MTFWEVAFVVLALLLLVALVAVCRLWEREARKLQSLCAETLRENTRLIEQLQEFRDAAETHERQREALAGEVRRLQAALERSQKNDFRDERGRFAKRDGGEVN